MADGDDRDELDEVTACARTREHLDLFVLDALEPDEAAAVEAHLAGCEACRAARDRAASAVESLLLLTPDAEVSDAFVDRVVGTAGAAPGQRSAPTLAPSAAVPPGPNPGEGPVVAAEATSSVPSTPRRRGVRILAIAAALLLVALALTAVGAAVGAVFASDERVADPPTTTSVGDRTVPLLSSSGDALGSVAVDDGDPSTLVMVVDRVRPGVGYDCVVRGADGRLVTVGSWTPASEGRASWSVALDPAIGPVDEVLLVGAGGTTLATASIG